MTISLPKNIRGIIFDLDGTLYQMQWFMKPLLTIKLFPNILFLPGYLSIRKTFSGKDMGNGESLLNAMAEKLSQKVKMGNKETMLAWISNRFYREFDNIMPLLKGSRPEINTVLSQLKQKGYKLGVLSDFAHVKERLNGLDIPCSTFDTLLSSESEGCLKPCTRPLHAIAESWQLQPSMILIIGDRDDTDGIAASQAGMQYLKISDKKNKPNNGFSWKQIKESLNTLPALEK